MKKNYLGLLPLSLIIVLAACSSQPFPSNNLTANSINHSGSEQSFILRPTPTPFLSIPSQQATPPPTSTSTPTSKPSSNCVTYSNRTTQVPAQSGTLAAPYGSAPASAEAQQLAQQLLQLINHDRAACGLPPFAWNATLASGALLHSWNMAHCGLSHTCPDGSEPCQRIANEGFAGLSDCGENIAHAGPYPTPWGGVSSIQEGMAHEALGGWHRIHLFSTTLHTIGIGVYVDSGGWIWFTEDMVA